MPNQSALVRTIRAEQDQGTVAVGACPICLSTQAEPFEGISEGSKPVSYRLCTDCGLVYQSPRMSDAALQQYYQAQYVAQHQRATGVSEKELRVQAGRARHLVRLLRPQVESVAGHLDLGCSAGLLLEAVRGAYGCQSVGVEPAEVYRNYCAARGLTVLLDLDRLAEAGHDRFDLVSVAHLVEHLADPVGYLADLRNRWLLPGSKLLVEVPNLFGHTSLETPHLVCFHSGTLRQTLAAAGYRVLRLIRHGEPRSRLIPLYLTAIAEPAASSVSRESVRTGAGGVRPGRRLGMAWHRLATRLAPGWAWLPLPKLIT